MLNVITRDQWGAQPANPAVAVRPLDQVTAWVVHYTDAAALPLLENEEEAVRAIQNYHMLNNGWFDIAYHYLIGNDGNVFAGRRADQVGAHCQGFNTPSIGVAFLTDDGISPAAGAAFVELVQTVEFVVLHRQLNIDKHSEHVQTSCPGPKVGPWVDAVRGPGGPLARPRL